LTRLAAGKIDKQIPAAFTAGISSPSLRVCYFKTISVNG
jgi:hypothetical protein